MNKLKVIGQEQLIKSQSISVKINLIRKKCFFAEKLNLTVGDYNDQHFELLNKKKTIKKKGGDSDQGLYLSDKIVFDGNTKEFSFKIDNS